MATRLYAILANCDELANASPLFIRSVSLVAMIGTMHETKEQLTFLHR
jgi:hypothetical protein